MIDIKCIIRIAEHTNRLFAGEEDHEKYPSNDLDKKNVADACLVAYSYIVREINSLTPEIPILSEATNEIYNGFCGSSKRNWLIKISESNMAEGEYSASVIVEISLIGENVPVLGLVHLPFHKTTYWGTRDLGAFKSLPNGDMSTLKFSTLVSFNLKDDHAGSLVTVGALKSGDSRQYRLHMDANSPSLTLCAIVERVSGSDPAVELVSWFDLAAGHAVVIAAGGEVLLWPTLQPLRYDSGKPIPGQQLFLARPVSTSSVKSDSDRWSDGIIYERRENDSKAEVIWHRTQVDQAMRASSLKQQPRCIWLTGLSGSGKSTIANSLELHLYNAGRHTFLLDGDNVRQGLNKDLGMSVEDRAENIRRVGEVARLMVDAGMIVVTAFISPFRADRQQVRSLFTEGSFLEVFVDTPLEECERRDVKGLYAKARRGELKDFTGIDSSYEIPISPDVHLHPAENTIDECVQRLILALESRN
jgi:adenylyl-sulfate kinase